MRHVINIIRVIIITVVAVIAIIIVSCRKSSKQSYDLHRKTNPVTRFVFSSTRRAVNRQSRRPTLFYCRCEQKTSKSLACLGRREFLEQSDIGSSSTTKTRISQTRPKKIKPPQFKSILTTPNPMHFRLASIYHLAAHRR